MAGYIPRCQQGATLIEVLITMIVLAVGLLGLAGMQITSVKSNQSAYYRSQATFLAYEISDRMRANRIEAQADAYKVEFPDSSSSNSVTGSQAKKDKAQWLNDLANLLPDGTGSVERNDSLLTISVRWNDDRGRIKGSGDNESFIETFIYRTEI